MSGFSLTNITIRSKLLFIVLVPIIGLLALAALEINLLQGQAYRQGELAELMEISVAANNLVHELQKERGASAGYTNSKGTAFADVLVKQHSATDEKRAGLEDVLKKIDATRFGEKYVAELNAALGDLAKIEEKRKQILGLALPLPDVVAYYIDLNANFLDVTEQSLFVAKDPEILRKTSAYLSFIQSKERAGIERAVGSAGFSGGWNNALLEKFKTLITVQDTYIDVFLSYASAEDLSFYEQKSADPSFAEVNRMRKIAVMSMDASSITQEKIDSEVWFKIITQKINMLKNIEDNLANGVATLANKGKQEALAERNFYLITLTILISVVLVTAFLVLKDLLSSINNTKTVMEVLSSGNENVEIAGTGRKDEIGGMARSIEVFKKGLIERKQMEEQALKAQARAEEQKRQLMLDMAASFDAQVGGLISSLASASTELQSTAENMRTMADETSQSSQTVAASSEEASTNVGTVASAMEEMSATSMEIASQITTTRSRSNETASDAQAANQTVGNLNGLVNNIGEVVIAIQGIAEQTNLLALNATIEAARAGESGKGFAVVADEVKKLATETAKKTNEINERINEIQTATQNSVVAMQRIIKNIGEIDESVTGVSAAVEEQNATTSEIVRSVSEASLGVQNVSKVIIEVQKGASITGTSADAVLEAAKEVSQISNRLKDEVHGFLDQIRNDNAKKS